MDGDVSLESSCARTCTCLETLLVGKRGLVESRETHGAIANDRELRVADLAGGCDHDVFAGCLEGCWRVLSSRDCVPGSRRHLI